MNKDRIELLRELLKDHVNETWHDDIDALCNSALYSLTDERIIELKKLACKAAWTDIDDLNIYNYSGSNVDDAFDGGETSGRINLAREILREIDIEIND